MPILRALLKNARSSFTEMAKENKITLMRLFLFKMARLELEAERLLLLRMDMKRMFILAVDGMLLLVTRLPLISCMR